jgi:transketolase
MTQTVDRGTRVAELAAAADRIRHHILNMGEVQGQGYVGQGLGFADVLAVIYKDLTTYHPEDPHWDGRDRVLLSMGHYAIAEYAALAEAGIIGVDELETYGSDDSRLPMSGMSTYTPGMEISGGSLGHGLGVGVGIALGLRFQGNNARVVNMMSDGELDEGSTWEAAMAAAHHGLGNLLCVVDMNGLQADGPTTGVLRTEPIVDKWQAFGWRTVRVDGNDINALVAAFDSVPAGDSPAVVICDTRIGRGVPFLETRERAHFIRIDENEWDLARQALRATNPAGSN